MSKVDIPVPEEMLDKFEQDGTPEKRLRDLIIIYDECDVEEVTFDLHKVMIIPDAHLLAQSVLVNEFGWSECNALAGYGLYLAEHVRNKELSSLFCKSVAGTLHVDEANWVLAYYAESLDYE